MELREGQIWVNRELVTYKIIEMGKAACIVEVRDGLNIIQRVMNVLDIEKGFELKIYTLI